MINNIILVIIGFIILIKGADYLVSGASQIAKRFHISEIIIGMTIVALGTSMPELIVSVKSATEGFSDITLGNVIGSNLLNLLLILGICAMIKGLEIKKEVRIFDNPFNLVITFVLLLLCNTGAGILGISQNEGIILLCIFGMYIIYMIVQAKKNPGQDEFKSNEKKIPMWKVPVYLVIGIIGLKYGADFVVDNAVEIAQALGVSQKIIGLTIVAIGTSLPELVSSITAVKKGENDLAIGNIIGSNIFNILLILGVAGTIAPINYDPTYNLDIIVLFFSTLLLMFYPYIGKKNMMTRLGGTIYVSIYIIYMFTLLVIR